MDAREKLMQILDKPVFPEGKDCLEAVTDYLLENDVVPVVRCKDCKHYEVDHNGLWCGNAYSPVCGSGVYPNFYCAKSERRDLDAND